MNAKKETRERENTETERVKRKETNEEIKAESKER
jgi:hypothetical protein